MARQWYEKAAVKGHPSAQLSLGTMYQDGDTVTQNFVTAYMWYYASAIQGNEVAPKKMNILRREMKLFPNQVNRAEELASPYIMNPKFEMNEPPVF
jgi:TPR repeat protein